jgi:hypothetical protein
MVVLAGAGAPAVGQTGLAWAMDVAARMAGGKEQAASQSRNEAQIRTRANEPARERMSASPGANSGRLRFADAIDAASKAQLQDLPTPAGPTEGRFWNGPVVVQRPQTNLAAGANPNGNRYCIRIFEGDARGVSDTGRGGVIGYNLLLVNEDPPAKSDEPAKGVEQPKAVPPAPAAQPTLDELLGIKPLPVPEKPKDDKGAAGTSNAGTPTDASKADLNRRLSGEELSDAFKQAVALMGDASARLTAQKDPGLDTQRIQEDAIKRLDQLISSLQKSQQQSQSQSKPQDGKQDPKDGPPQQGKPKPGKPKPGESEQEAKGGNGERKGLGPELKEGALNPQLESARAAWGSLPARVREMLMQGTEDRFSARYKALTQEYYKRLAEENSK